MTPNIPTDKLTAALRALLSNVALPTAKVTMILQWTGVAVTILILFGDVLPPKWAAVSVGVVAVLKALQAALAQYANPDGTPAQAPWEAPKTK